MITKLALLQEMLSSSVVRHVRRSLGSASRRFSAVGATGESVEAKIKAILQEQFAPTLLDVTDTSGGCGAMFNIIVESPQFTGKSLVASHKMVTKALKAEIKEMHGLTLTTKAS